MITGLDPTSGPLDRSPDKGMAQRPDSLEGATIALVVTGHPWLAAILATAALLSSVLSTPPD